MDVLAVAAAEPGRCNALPVPPEAGVPESAWRRSHGDLLEQVRGVHLHRVALTGPDPLVGDPHSAQDLLELIAADPQEVEDLRDRQPTAVVEAAGMAQQPRHRSSVLSELQLRQLSRTLCSTTAARSWWSAALLLKDPEL